MCAGNLKIEEDIREILRTSGRTSDEVNEFITKVGLTYQQRGLIVGDSYTLEHFLGGVKRRLILMKKVELEKEKEVSI